jgi:hypothetical protein
MKNKMLRYFSFCLLLLIFNGCKKNQTEFFEDSQKNGLSIFSNKGFNLLTCYVNSVPWKTADRVIKVFGGSDTEIEIEKNRTNALKDTLIFIWKGVKVDSFNYKSIELRIAVDSSFRSKDFKSTFSGKRIVIDSTFNGYFRTNINTQFVNRDMPNIKGNGVILFQKANIDFSSPQNDNSIVAGLLSTKIGTNEITDGRFDHSLNTVQINF